MFKVSFQSYPVSDFLDLPSSYPLEEYKDPISFDHPNTVAFYPGKNQKYCLVVDNKEQKIGASVLVFLQGTEASTSIIVPPSTRKWIRFDDSCTSVKLSKFGPGFDSVSKNKITYQFWTF